jgi:type II secretory pathway pseudopilin PulG
MNTTPQAHPRGSMIIEVLLSLTMVVVLVVVVGNTLGAVHRLERASELRGRALGYAKEYLEIADTAKNQIFPPVSSGCTPQPGYTKCWAAATSGSLRLVFQSGSWVLQTGADTTTYPGFTRTLTVQDLSDTNIKQITVTVAWVDRGATKQLQLNNVLTAWNVP